MREASELVQHEAMSARCSVCGARARVPELALEGWRILRCRGCGLRTLDPAPTEVQLEEFNDGSGYDAAFALRDEIRAQHHRSLAALERHVSPGRLLDVGCGPGFLLEVARERGWDAVGVDPSPFSVETARAAGFEAHQGMLEDLSLEPASFDALALLQVVEHMTDARPLLAACRALLRPGGALLVATPNPVSLLARAKREAFNYWIPPIHCAWYPPRTLARLLRDAGTVPASVTTWSARTPALHDGVDALGASRLGRLVPARARRRTGDLLARAADALGRGTIVEAIAIEEAP